jgi:hypothetical protein
MKMKAVKIMSPMKIMINKQLIFFFFTILFFQSESEKSVINTILFFKKISIKLKNYFNFCCSLIKNSTE